LEVIGVGGRFKFKLWCKFKWASREGFAGEVEFEVGGEFLGGAPGYAGDGEAGAKEDLAAGLIDKAVCEEVAGGEGEGVTDVGEGDGF